MLLVHASPATLEAHRHPNLGVLGSPRRFYRDLAGWDWALDNDAFSQWDEHRYIQMIDAAAGLELQRCRFVTCPDVVADWEDTVDLYELWADELHRRGLPLGFILQDGQPERWVPWEDVAAIFIGGTSEYKLGPEAAQLAREAKRRGLWLHMGRVNTYQRIRYAKAIGCDSADGTSFSWFRDRWLDDFLRHAAAPVQLMLDENPPR